MNRRGPFVLALAAAIVVGAAAGIAQLGRSLFMMGVAGIAVVLAAVELARLRRPTASENAARAAQIRARYSVTVGEDIVASSADGGFARSVKWSAVDEVLLAYETVQNERLGGWLLKSPHGECFVPDHSNGIKALERAIRSLPGYFEQAVVRTSRGRSHWRRTDRARGAARG